MFEKKAQTRVPINELLARRWSGRGFDPSRQISRQHVTALLEAARWTPSCYGEEPWRYIVCDKATNETAWRNAFVCFGQGNQIWAVNTPLFLLTVSNTILENNGLANQWGKYDTGAASMSLCIQATELGLMVHQMGGFDAEMARQKFNIPDQYDPMSMLAIGYQLPLESIPEELRAREMSDRRRNPLTENFFEGEWGVGFRY